MFSRGGKGATAARRRLPVATIGPAGERGVRFATISHDRRHAGRGGSGAVLGSKNLKAVAVRGTRRCEWAHPNELFELSRDLSDRSFGPATAKYRELGTAANLLTFNRLGVLPTRNFQAGSFEDAARLSSTALGAQYPRVRSGCVACTIGCEHLYEVDHASVRIEYESLFALGHSAASGDSTAVLRASQLCDELGIDTVSAGGTIAFAMECVERGLLDEGWLTFGSGDAVLKALELIGGREGVGDLLAEGSRPRGAGDRPRLDRVRASGQGDGDPGYEPRALQTMALGFAVGSRGADHNRSGAYESTFRQGGSPACDRRFRASRDRRGRPFGVDGLADPVQVSAARADGFLRRGGGHASPRPQAGTHARGTTRDARRLLPRSGKSTCWAGGRRRKTRCRSDSSPRRCPAIPRP